MTAWTPLFSTKQGSNSRSLIVALVAALMSLMPPYLVGTGSSGLTLQSLEHWIAGTPDQFEALHVHWLWFPRLVGFITQDAFVALVVTRAIVIALVAWLFERTATRMLDGTRGLLAVAMLLLNVTLLALMHSFGGHLVTLLVATAILYLFSTASERSHKLAALIFGLALSLGFWPWVLLLGVMTIGLNIHHAIYTPRAKETAYLLGYIVLGAASYLLLELFSFGWAGLGSVMFPPFYAPHGVNLIAQGLVIALFTLNVLLLAPIRGKKGTVSRDFQNAFVILGIFTIMNLLGREDMLYAAVLLVPCATIAALDKARSPLVLGGIYLAVDLALFIALPAVATDPQIALSERMRQAPQDQIAYSYYRAEDLFNAAQVREVAAWESEAKALLGAAPLDSTIVLINDGTDWAFDDATLGGLFPTRRFGWFYGMPINQIRVNGLRDTAYIRPDPSNPYLAGLFEKTFARQFIDSAMAPSAVIRESEHLQLILTRQTPIARKELVDRVIELEYQGMRHH